MARQKQRPHQLPRVFVGSAYGRPFNFKAFRQALDDIPFRLVYAKDRLKTQHILENCRELIERADFCLFDVSTWNANVTLELGLAEGLGIDYYILSKRSPTKGVPADITGIQRIEYSAYNQCDLNGTVLKHGLWQRVAESLAPQDPVLAPLWRSLGGLPNPDKCRLFSFRLLAGLREHRSIALKKVASYSQGTRLQQANRDKALEIMVRRKLIKKTLRSVSLSRRLFAPE